MTRDESSTATVAGNDPFARLDDVPAFDLHSDTLADGAPLPLAQYSARFGVVGGEDRSPHLRWSGAPERTRSYVVTVYDPDAPTGSGFWHWVVADLPAHVSELAAGAGSTADADLPGGARQLGNDAGFAGFLGAAPPPGHGVHRYVIVVNALDVDRLDVPDDASPALVGFALRAHLLARAVLTATGAAR
ncbi:YbhB/YbcL family Raf kinase inhibitor-like protein [Homoserinibacter sp. YIM 151385]|uniref:YbhB/YbcL family Raf kinase inhibitor-like protein n=1 Tax=Homoserinibacter sp. YIM 151385 TaxID=2985506 RepID=UPI0022F0B94B|nr:YbhB/YbcL family Raf kinase inhibitor-like protein [Homoserinibacter sp. YIM 151385]WBU36887.1 YbhB/YbcL family Raf kinase inhibitor-like protein [Homoserinibacter sp. YIM 151385]